LLRASGGIAARIGVSMMPGDTTLNRTGAISRARPCANVSSAALMAPISTILGLGRRQRTRMLQTFIVASASNAFTRFWLRKS
jgi:hypothetical protein